MKHNEEVSVQELAKELRALCDGAPELSDIVMLNFFGISRAEGLRGMRILDLAGISALAGLSESHGHEIRKGVNLSEFVSLKDDRNPEWVFVRRLSSISEKELERMAQRLEAVCVKAPKKTLIATLALFGVRHFDELEIYTHDDLCKVCVLAGIKKMHGGEIRRGVRLATYVNFRSYPA